MKDCAVCCLQPSKYKCTKCYIPFCSVDCNKRHNAGNECIAAKKETVDSSSSTAFETEDTVPRHALDRLGTDEKIMKLLEDPELRACLQTIDSTSQPNETLEKAMKLPIFQQFADACMTVVDGES